MPTTHRIIDEYDEACAEFERTSGVRLQNTRFSGGIARFRDLGFSQFSDLSREELNDLGNILVDAGAMRAIARFVPQEFLRTYPELKRLHGGGVSPKADGSKTDPRNWQHELYTAARLFRLGFKLRAHEPDLLLYDGNQNLGIACKRVSSKKGVERNLRSGAAQIQASGIDGIVAIEVKRVVLPEDQVVLSDSKALAKALPIGMLLDLSNRYGDTIRGVLDSSPLAEVLLTMSFTMIYPVYPAPQLKLGVAPLYGIPPTMETVHATRLVVHPDRKPKPGSLIDRLHVALSTNAERDGNPVICDW